MFPSPTIGGKEFRDKTRDKKNTAIQNFGFLFASDGIWNSTGDGGSATPAELCYAWSVAVSSSDTIYFPDLSYGRVRKISGGIITTFVGSGCGFNGDGLWPLYIAFDDPVAVAVDSKGAV